MSKTFYVIGIDDNQQQFFPPEVTAIINAQHIFSGGKRHKELVEKHLPHGAKWIPITIPLQKVFDAYQPHQTIVVFASGDPLFLGFANTLKREFPKAELKVFPFFNSLQLLAHRLLLPYHDMHIVSLTGRPWHKFDEALILGYEKIGVLTDNKRHTPKTISKRMLEFGYSNYKMTIGELLGNKEKERITTLSIEEVAAHDFEYPNNILLERIYARNRPLGIPEQDFHFLNGREKMITKMPIRLLSLSLLDLRNKNVFWDIGFCTGSVSIEAKLQFPHLHIYSFEKREEGDSLMRENSMRFGVPGIEHFIGDFTQQCLDEILPPDAIFIGGHGGKMLTIVSKIEPLLQAKGAIVFNSVSENSYLLFKEACQANNLQIVTNTTIALDKFNPIRLLKAIKI